MYKNFKVSVIIPALNEEFSILHVISDIPKDIVDEIIVVDNGSRDHTVTYAKAAGAKVVEQSIRGYGAACQAGIAEADEPDIVVILDADYSDYPDRISILLDPIVNHECDMVLGSRVLGHAEEGAMGLAQIWGNKLTVFLIRSLLRFSYSDMGPFRAIRYDSLQKLKMSDMNYGWNVEMQMKAIKAGFDIIEVPVDYRCRIGKSKISGTAMGVIKAGVKIIYSVFKYWLIKV